MREYSPRRRTALVLTGSGTAGAYHAGVLRAVDESGVKIDLLVGAGAAALAAALGGAAAGAKVYGPGGFWDGASGRSFFRTRRALLVPGLLIGVPVGAFVVPLGLALLAGVLSPLYLIGDRLAPSFTARVLEP